MFYARPVFAHSSSLLTLGLLRVHLLSNRNGSPIYLPNIHARTNLAVLPMTVRFGKRLWEKYLQIYLI